MRAIYILIIVLAAPFAGWAVNHFSYRYFVTDEVAKADGTLSLYRSSITAELEQYAPLIYVLARDPVLINGASTGDMAYVNPRLRDFSDQAGLDAIYFIRPDGITTAASNFENDLSFIGQDYSFRPYFQIAANGQRGQFYAIGATTGLPGFFLSEPVVSDAGETLGVIVLKISFATLKQTWVSAGEQVFLANEDGVIILTSTADWAYRTLAPLSDEQRSKIATTRQFADIDLTPLDWRRTGPQTAEVNNDPRLYLMSNALPYGWSLHYFVSDDRAVARSWLVTAGIAILAGLAVLVVQIQHARQVGQALRRSEKEESILRTANDKLALEIAERRQAESELRRTQRELQKASRLAALGELSASVTHELGQPISAMRNHLAAAEYRAPDGKVLGKLGGLVDRMEGITKQLKFFATPDPEPFEVVDLRTAMSASIGLLQHRIDAAQVAVDQQIPDTPMQVWGSRLRIEQVMTNLIRNALDAVDETNDPQLMIAMGQDQENVWFSVGDNGHGLGQSTLNDLAEPFVTTRASGAGMGLGLAISANIIKDHDGEMTALNRDTGGAIFRVTFPAAHLPT